MDRERDIEKYLTDELTKLNGLSFKWISPGNAGVPDRIAILPGGLVWFIELKTGRNWLDKIQGWQIKRLLERNCNVTVIRSKADVRSWIEEVKEVMGIGICPTQLPAKGY